MNAFCFCKHARPAMIAWGYIKMILMLLSIIPLALVLVNIMYKSEQYEMILLWSILLSYPTAFGFNITLIVALLLRNVKTLQVCFYYLIIELSMLLLLVPWILEIIFDFYDVVSSLPFIAVITILVIVQGVFSIIMVNAEIGKLAGVGWSSS